MKTTSQISFVVAVGLLGAAADAIVVESDALAQSSTTGAVRGVVRDRATGDSVIGATVVISGPALQGQQAEITDENGAYVIQNLPPGTYVLTVFYNEAQFDRPNVLIQVGKQSVVNVTINTEEAVGGETIVVEGRAPIVDQGSTKTGATITSEYTENIPVGRTFASVLGAAAGSQQDLYGVSFSGSTSVESTYIVEGINTTDTAFGGISSNLPNEFIQETEVITGGYNAEFGRSTGGVINVVTKQGGNEFHGSVFGYFTPGALVAAAEQINREGTAIDTETNLDFQWDLGAEVGGPIIKDKLWFHVGVNPSFQSYTTDRVFSNQVDRDGDGIADTDPETGLTVVEEITREEIPLEFNTYYYTGKINGVVTEDHQYQISGWGNPRNAVDTYAPVSAPSRNRYKYDTGAYDASAKWTSKFAEGKTQVDAVAGFHRGYQNESPYDNSGEEPRLFYRYVKSLEDFAAYDQVPDECVDPDPADDFIPCPVDQYSIGGLGFLEERTNDRLSGTLAVTQRVKVAGYHTFKAGIDLEQTTYDATRRYTGGAIYEHFASGRQRRRTLLEALEPGVMGEIECADIDGDGVTDVYCDILQDGVAADTKNFNIGGYLQDSWQIRPNLTINAGLRYEQQTGYVAEAIQGGTDPYGETIPEVAYKLTNMWAPRLGVIYDPTQEGRAKLFGHWGRFYETVPMDINVRAFGGEIIALELTSSGNASCADPDAASNADALEDFEQCQFPVTQGFLGLGTEYVTPGLRGQYIEEIILGAEYELMPDFKLGVNYIHRDLPVAIEDMSTDGGNTYFIGNPGEDYTSEAEALEDEAMEIMDSDPLRADLLLTRAGYLRAAGDFDKPSRTYDGIEVHANQRFSKNALLLASYTYSRSVGNFPGLFSTETGQLDPNLTSMYDLPDLMANRYGAMGLDRPHNLKIDGFYQFDLKEAGLVILGASFRAQSGLAQNTLASHVFYGTGESYLLPRGQIDRGPFTWQADIKGTYGRKIGKTTRVEGFIDVFNLFNNQEETDVDENYTYESVNPVVDGDIEDLRHAKSLDTLNTPVLNKNFGNTSNRQAPLSVRFGVRVTF